MRGTALLQRAYTCRMRHKDVVSLAEQVLPGYEGVFQIINSLVGTLDQFSMSKNKIRSIPPSQFLNHRIALNLLTAAAQVYHNLELSQKWAEIKPKWPEAREGPIVFSGDVSRIVEL